MCAILDANLVGEVFRADPEPAAGQFFNWMYSHQCRLVIGGELRRELEQVESFVEWADDAALDGRLQVEDDQVVDELARKLSEADDCLSNDEHVIALARVSGARLLFSRDEDLRVDFRNASLLQPRGKTLPLGGNDNARKQRRSLLDAPDLCPRYRR